MRKSLPVIVILALGVLVLRARLGDVPVVGPSGGGLGYLAVYGTLPGFSLVDTAGNPFTDGSVKGSVWVASFIFTRCGGPCPVLCGRMADLQEEFRAERGVRLVSVTVDPDYDTPRILAAFAARVRADPERWVFATGEKEAVHALARDGFKLGGTEDVTLHSTRFVLVDALFRIRGYYDGTDAAAFAALRSDLRALLRAEGGP
ncbi:MAG: SCO family protein [Planctomycetes bacterium]|nr:SCO family protein [Planctomycetota bacterium]